MVYRGSPTAGFSSEVEATGRWDIVNVERTNRES